MIADAAHRRVLVVDDNAGIRELMTIVLEAAKVDVQTAGDGFEAVELVRRQPFDLIFLDFGMPRLTGLEAATIVRRLTPTIPIVLMSGNPPPDADIRRAGIAYTLRKPFLMSEVIRCLDSMVPASTVSALARDAHVPASNLKEDVCGA